MQQKARMAKLVDALASGASTVKGMEVRVLFRAPALIYRNKKNRVYFLIRGFMFSTAYFFIIKPIFRC